MIEIEKKYKVTKEMFDSISSIWANSLEDEVFEENVLYNGDISIPDKVFRLRTTTLSNNQKQILFTFKESISNTDGLKVKKEIEFHLTEEENFKDFLVSGLNLKPFLVYEKKRRELHLIDCIVCFDELPFGYFIELEGSKAGIERLEKNLEIEKYVERNSYPSLTVGYGVRENDIFQARFIGR